MSDQKEKNELVLKSREETISEGVAFLLEMGQVDSAPVQNALILNILKVSDHIRDAQILADQEKRKMLVYLKLGFWGNYWFKKQIAEDVFGMLRQVLPAFDFRVVYDYAVFEKGLQLAEKLARLRGRFGPRF